MLEILKFSGDFITLIMQCVIFVSFQVLIKGEPLRSFIPEQGLRQGNPLSLFIFCYLRRGSLYTDVQRGARAD